MSLLNKIKNLSKKQPLVSVIIPIYNTEEFLDKCLESVESQTFKDIEIICIDDCSSDSSIDIIEKHSRNDNRIKIIRNHVNLGLSATRNKGLNIAKGEYILFVDSDDWIEYNTVELLYTKANELKTDILLYKIHAYDLKTNELVDNDVYSLNYLNKEENILFNHNDIDKENLFNIPVTVYGKLYLKRFLDEKHILFKENIIYEDNLFFLKTFLQADRISFLDEYLYYRLLHPNSIISNNGKEMQDIIDINELCLNFLLDNKKYYNRYNKQFYNKMFNNIKNKWYAIDSDYNNDFFNHLKDFINKIVVEKNLDLDIRNSLNQSNLSLYNLVLLSIKSENQKIIKIQEKIEYDTPLTIVSYCNDSSIDEINYFINNIITQSFGFPNIELILFYNKNSINEIKELLINYDYTYHNIKYLELDDNISEIESYNIGITESNNEFIMFTNVKSDYNSDYIKEIFRKNRENNLNITALTNKDDYLDHFLVKKNIFKRQFLLDDNKHFINDNENILLDIDLFFKEKTIPSTIMEEIEVLDNLLLYNIDKFNDDNYYNFMIDKLRHSFLGAKIEEKEEYFIQISKFIYKCISKYNIDNFIQDKLDKNNLIFYNYVIQAIDSEDSKIFELKNYLRIESPISIIIYCRNNSKEDLDKQLNTLITQSIGFPTINIVYIDNNSDNTETISTLDKYESIYPNIKHVYLENMTDKIEALKIGVIKQKKQYLMFMDNNHEFEQTAIKNIFRKFREKNSNMASGTINGKKDSQNNPLIFNKIFKKDFLIDKNIRFIYNEEDIIVADDTYDDSRIITANIPVLKY